MKKLMYLPVLIAMLVLLVSGCTVQQPADFSDPGVYAYVNGTPVYTEQIQQYKDISKLYWQAVADLGDEPSEIEVENPEALEWVFSLNYNKAQDYLALDDEGWTRAYYKIILISDDLYRYSETDIQDIFALADTAVKQSLQTGKMTYIDGSQLDISSMLDTLSEKYGMSREDCAEKILKAFLCSMGEDEALIRYFEQNDYKGTPVGWDGSNTEECIAYLEDLYTQYGAYIDGLLEQAEIIERS
jgi:hypothetical protein